MPFIMVFSGAMVLSGAMALLGTVPALAAPTHLLPHRAIYDLSLDTRKESAGVADVSGRMVYEFVGSACAGYTMSMRFVSHVADSDGKTIITDLRARTWESADGGQFNFNSEQYVGSNLRETVTGSADRGHEQAIEVALKKPASKKFGLGADVLFPTQHLEALILSAQKGDRILMKQVFDGSETGEKIYDTTAVIGNSAIGQTPGQEVAGKTSQLKDKPRWPVSIAYFEQGEGGEQVPSYQLSFNLYASGVSDALRLDYGAFALKGTLREIEFIEEKRCN